MIQEVNIAFVQGGAQEPQSGSWAGEGGGAGAAVGLQVLLPQQFLQRFVEQIIEDAGTEEVFKVFSEGKVGGFISASWSRTTLRGSGSAVLRRDRARAVLTWKPEHFSTSPPSVSGSPLALVFLRQTTKPFGRISCGFFYVSVYPDTEVDSPFALEV